MKLQQINIFFFKILHVFIKSKLDNSGEFFRV